MFVRQNQQQFRTANADVQIFYGDGGTVSTSIYRQTWNKPPGVSHVYMMAIGAGADGNGTQGGGSGAVTVWYGAAQNVPDNLVIAVGVTSATIVGYRSTSNTINTLIQANAGSGATGGAATTAGVFAASGFYQSVAGQNGVSTGGISASTTTFLAGGGGSGSQDSNYGYSTPTKGGNRDGYLLLQPIIVGMGGAVAGVGGIGCGGGSTLGSLGGSGMVLIASW